MAVDNAFYKGIVDDIRIYNRAIIEDEITALYNQQLVPITANLQEGFYEACGDTIEHPWFQAIAQDSSKVFTVDEEGNMYVYANSIHYGDTSNISLANSFIIKASSGDTVLSRRTWRLAE